MNKNALIKVTLFSLTVAVVLSLVSLLFMNRFMSIQGARFRDDFMRFYAASIEQRIHKMPLEQVKIQKDLLKLDRDFRPPMPPPPNGAMMGPPPPHMMPPPPGDLPEDDHRPPPPRDKKKDRVFRGPRGPGPGPGRLPPPFMEMESWIVTEDGGVVLFKKSSALPEPWNELPHPSRAKELSTTENFFRIGSYLVVIRLDTEIPLYLVIKEANRPPHMANLILTQAILTSLMIVIALGLSVVALFLYMRKKSLEARSVLQRLEQGDLKARFEIHRLDEFGGLMLDFNRMAEEIEKLVGRIHATERTRKQLLQEMGHDLRTPLTSLKTSFETLQIHHDKLSPEKRSELFDVLIREIDYFKDLIEQLMTIASLDEPHFKASTESIEVTNLVTQEVHHRKSAGPHIEWLLESSTDKTILGDSHLIQRLLRNGLDNAQRYANSKVSVKVSDEKGLIKIEICDDGSGLDEASIKGFGERREFRGRKITKNGHFSLGLGSVIMKAIAELHNGQIKIENIQTNGHIEGAKLTITLPTT